MDDFSFDSSGFDSMDYYDYGSSSSADDAISALLGGGLFAGIWLIVAGVIALIVLVVGLYFWSRYYSKMGYSGWLALLWIPAYLLSIIPIVNFIGWLAPIVMFAYFAFAKWPIEKKLEELQSGSKMEASKEEAKKE